MEISNLQLTGEAFIASVISVCDIHICVKCYLNMKNRIYIYGAAVKPQASANGSEAVLTNSSANSCFEMYSR